MNLKRGLVLKWLGGAIFLLIIAFGLMFSLGVGVFSEKASVRLACHNPMLYNCEQILEEIEESDVFYLSKGEPEFWIVFSRGTGLNPSMSAQLYTNKDFAPGYLVDLRSYNRGPISDTASVLRAYGIKSLEDAFRTAKIGDDFGVVPSIVFEDARKPDLNTSVFFVRTACINPSGDECSFFSHTVREHPRFVIPNHAVSKNEPRRGCANNPNHSACSWIKPMSCTQAEVKAGKDCVFNPGVPPDHAEGLEWSPVAYTAEDILEEYKAADFQDDFWFIYSRGLDGTLKFSLHAFSVQGDAGHPGDSGEPIFQWSVPSEKLEVLNEETVDTALEEIFGMIDMGR